METSSTGAPLRFASGAPTAAPPGAEALIPVVVQDVTTGEVRMVAFANEEAVRLTLATGRGTFFSRSRNALWEKGATSGHGLSIDQVVTDCDADCLLYLVRPAGPTCHTGRRSCFYRPVTWANDAFAVADDDATDPTRIPTPTPTPGPIPTTLLARLDAVLEARRTATAERSYVRSLYDGGAPRIGDKLREEADELARATADESDARVVSEAADVLFHTMVALRSRGLSIDAVLAELDRRMGTSGHDEKRARG